MRGKLLSTQHLRVEEPTHLGCGQGRDVTEPCGGQRALALYKTTVGALYRWRPVQR